MRKITIVIASIIIAFAIIVPLGFFDLFDHSYIIKADSVNSYGNYMLSANFTAHSSTSTYDNPNYIKFDTTTYVDRGTANQSTLSLNNLVMEYRDDFLYTICGITTLSGNFSFNVSPRSMYFVMGVENFTSVNNKFTLGTQVELIGPGCIEFPQNNTTIDSRLAIDGTLHECKFDNFTNNISVSLDNSDKNLHNAGGRYYFSLMLGVHLNIYPNTAVPKPFNFFVNVSLPGYTVPIYNSVDTRIVDNVTKGV